MVTTTPGQTARTHLIDHAVTDYGIELNHADEPVCQGLCTFHRCGLTAAATADNSGTDRLIRRLRSIPARTIVPAMDADESLISLKPAHSSETRQRSSYRGDCAFCLAIPGTCWQHTARGPPGAELSGGFSNPRGTCSKMRALSTSWIRRKKGRRKRIGGQTANPGTPIPVTRASLQALLITAYQKDN